MLWGELEGPKENVLGLTAQVCDFWLVPFGTAFWSIVSKSVTQFCTHHTFHACMNYLEQENHMFHIIDREWYMLHDQKWFRKEKHSVPHPANWQLRDQNSTNQLRFVCTFIIFFTNKHSSSNTFKGRAKSEIRGCAVARGPPGDKHNPIAGSQEGLGQAAGHGGNLQGSSL